MCQTLPVFQSHHHQGGVIEDNEIIVVYNYCCLSIHFYKFLLLSKTLIIVSLLKTL